MRPTALLSFDVEALPGRSAADGGRLVWSSIDGEECGIGRTCRILAEYRLKGGLRIDLSACLRQDDSVVSKKTSELSDVMAHDGAANYEKHGVDSARRHGLDDAIDLFASFFELSLVTGHDAVTGQSMNVFFLRKPSATANHKSLAEASAGADSAWLPSAQWQVVRAHTAFEQGA